MPAKPRVLVAAAQPGFEVLRNLFAGRTEAIFVFTLGEAIHQLGLGGIDLVVCTIHFDESRMFDFLRYAKLIAPSVPIVCCRLLDTALTGSMLDAMVIAVEAVGAVFIDRHALQRKYGEAAGDEQFVKMVLAHARQAD
jgi:hypothetical protein